MAGRNQLAIGKRQLAISNVSLASESFDPRGAPKCTSCMGDPHKLAFEMRITALCAAPLCARLVRGERLVIGGARIHGPGTNGTWRWVVRMGAKRKCLGRAVPVCPTPIGLSQGRSPGSQEQEGEG